MADNLKIEEKKTEACRVNAMYRFNRIGQIGSVEIFVSDFEALHAQESRIFTACIQVVDVSFRIALAQSIFILDSIEIVSRLNADIKTCFFFECVILSKLKFFTSTLNLHCHGGYNNYSMNQPNHHRHFLFQMSLQFFFLTWI